jgi:hypothetical protein
MFYQIPYAKLCHLLCERNTIVRKMVLLPTSYHLVSELLIEIEHFLDEGLSCDRISVQSGGMSGDSSPMPTMPRPATNIVSLSHPATILKGVQ